MVVKLPIDRVMSSNVISVEAEEKMDLVVKIFAKYEDMDHLPIVKKGELVGVIERKDIDSSINGKENLTAEGIMSRQFIKLSTQNTIQEAMEIFRTNLFHWIPIVDNNNVLVGVVTPQDLLKKESSPNQPLKKGFVRRIFH